MKKSNASWEDRDSQGRGDTLFGHNEKTVCSWLGGGVLMLMAGSECLLFILFTTDFRMVANCPKGE